MPIIKSSKKALRKSQKRKKHNLQKKRKLKDLLKKMNLLILEKKLKEAKELLPQIYKALDKAAKTNLIKKNTAGRRKSKINKSLDKTQEIKKQ